MTKTELAMLLDGREYSMSNPDIARCDREIARCLAYLERGGPEEIGAYVGLTDW